MYDLNGTISGSIHAAVQVDITGPVAQSTISDALGNYLFTNLPAGTYSVLPVAEGHVFTAQQIVFPVAVLDFTATEEAPPPPPPPPGGFTPANLAGVYAWAHAGDGTAAFIQRDEDYIDAWVDQSGQGHHAQAFYASNSKRPWYEPTVDMTGDPWNVPINVPHPTLIVGSKIPYKKWYGGAFKLNEPMVCPGEFYLCAAITNIRTSGKRDVFGCDDTENVVRLKQEGAASELYMAVAGVPHYSGVQIAANIPANVVVLEVWRDGTNFVHVRANGTDVGNGTLLAGTLTLGGIGGGIPNAQWDDTFFEAVMAIGDPSNKDDCRDYMLDKYLP